MAEEQDQDNSKNVVNDEVPPPMTTLYRGSSMHQAAAATMMDAFAFEDDELEALQAFEKLQLQKQRTTDEMNKVVANDEI